MDGGASNKKLSAQTLRDTKQKHKIKPKRFIL